MNKPSAQEIPTAVASLTGMSLPAPAGLESRLRGTDLDKPGDILRVVWVLLSDLNHVLSVADHRTEELGVEPICPGLARHDAPEVPLRRCEVPQVRPGGGAAKYTVLS